MKHLWRVAALLVFAAAAALAQCPQGYTLSGGKCVANNSGGGGAGIREISFVLCAGTNCNVGDTIAVPRNITASSAGTLQKCSVRFGTAPTASTVIEIHKNGSGTADATITASGATANTTTFADATLAENDYLTVLITAVGATPGQNANVICTVQ